MARLIKAAWLGAVVCLLTACGGSEAPVPESPTLNFTVRTNRIDLVWTSEIAGTYNLYRDSDGVSGPLGFELIGTLPSSSISVNLPASVHLFDWESEPQYYLEGCNLNGCGRSATFTISEASNLLATGYFKASNAGGSNTVANAAGEIGDQVGFSVALAAGGSIMALGAPYEDSNATGVVFGDGTIDGTPIPDRNADDYGERAPASGAVYLYAINLFGQWVQNNYIKAPNISTSNDVIVPTGVIDPEAAAIAAQNAGGEGDLFGYAVALSGSGEYLAIGAPAEDGSCPRFDPDNPDVTPDCPETDALADNSAEDSGAVYIYQRINSEWFITNYIKPRIITPGMQFGKSLAFDFVGGTLAIGAPNDSNGDNGEFNDAENPDFDLNDTAPDSGAVYIWSRSNTVWFQDAVIKPPAYTNAEEFGTAVALDLSGVTLAVGMPAEDGSNTEVCNASESCSYAFLGDSVGAVFVYSREPDANNFFDWEQQAYVKPPAVDIEDTMEFGTAVALSDAGDDLLVGAPGFNSDAGSAYLYQRDADLWSYARRFDAGSDLVDSAQVSNVNSGDRFGTSVALVALTDQVVDDTRYVSLAAIGAPGEAGSGQGVTAAPDTNANGSGAVYVFVQPDAASDWERVRYIKAPNSGPDFRFGAAVSLSGSGTSLLVGAPGEPVSSGGIGPNPDASDPSDPENQNTDRPGAGAGYLY